MKSFEVFQEANHFGADLVDLLRINMPDGEFPLVSFFFDLKYFIDDFRLQLFNDSERLIGMLRGVLVWSQFIGI